MPLTVGKPQAQQQQRVGRAQIQNFPAPVGGLNTRDSLANMPPQDALVLDNLVPRLDSCELRGGYEALVGDIADDIGGAWVNGPVETLMTLKIGGTEQMVAAMDGGLARVDTGTATEVEPRATYTVDRWQWTVFADSGASNTPFILAVNGTDTPWTYNGTTHAAWTFNQDAASTTEEDFVWIYVFKNRVYMGKENSRDFQYGYLGQIPGTTNGTDDLTTFPLGGVRGIQGNVLFMTSMTRDTGTGPDDFAVFVTDAGQAIIYAGSDPGSSSAWSLVGVYEIPKPINSRKAFAQLFGDVVIATELDYIFLSKTLQTSGATLTDPSKMTGAMQEASSAYGGNHGWEMVVADRDGVLMCNVPLETDTQYHQHVFNIQSRAACRFTGWNFSSFGRLLGRIYGGGNGAVHRCFSRKADDADGTDVAIQARAQTAWFDFGSHSNKQVHAARFFMKAEGDFMFNAAMGCDYEDITITTKASNGAAGATTLWGDDSSAPVTLWGDDSSNPETFWSGSQSVNSATVREWRLLACRGVDFSTVFAADVKGQEMSWISTEFKVSGARLF